MAYQIAFDLYDSATQQFLQRVTNALRSTVPLPEVEKTADKTEEDKKERFIITIQFFLIDVKCFGDRLI
jgi:hypothetical protein